jgi:hypothetical protein
MECTRTGHRSFTPIPSALRSTFLSLVVSPHLGQHSAGSTGFKSPSRRLNSKLLIYTNPKARYVRVHTTAAAAVDAKLPSCQQSKLVPIFRKMHPSLFHHRPWLAASYEDGSEVSSVLQGGALTLSIFYLRCVVWSEEWGHQVNCVCTRNNREGSLDQSQVQRDKSNLYLSTQGHPSDG